MAEFSGVEKAEKNEMSLYEMCLHVLGYEFDFIDRKYVKDLPKHILEQILGRLNPFHLETLENEGFLNLRGISTDSLWKDHFVRRFKRGARMPESRLENFTWNSWRAQYFERHFHMLIHKIAVTPINNIEIEKGSRDDLNEDLFRPPRGSRLSNISPLDMSDVFDLCIKHLTRIRIPHNTTCIYLAQHHDILMKLAPVLEHVKMEQLRDHSVKALILILDVLLNNKLKSFLLSNCKVENENRLRALLKVLAKSQSLDDRQCLTQCKLSVGDDDTEIQHDYTAKCNEEAGCTEEHNSKEFTDLEFGATFGENLKEHSNFENFKMIDSEDFSSSTSKCDTSHSGTSVNENLYNDLDVYKEGNTKICTLESENNLITISQGDEEKHSDTNCLRIEDDLYEDIFSIRRAEYQDACQKGDDISARIDSTPMRKPWEMEPKLELTSNQIHPHCLTELKLSSCLMDNTSLNVLSEELIFFLSLRSLALCDVGLCYFPAMSDLIRSIKELVIHGSLRHLVFENGSLNYHVNMFYDMLILSCERCQLTDACKGLSLLRLVGGVVINMDTLGEKLRTCSFCEETSSACRRPSGIWFETKDNTFYSACKCLNKGVLNCCDNSGFKNVDGNSSKLPVKNEDLVVNYEADVQPKPVRNNLARRVDAASSKHQYITTGIQSLHFSFRNIHRESATVLASSLLRNRSLRRISLPSCGLITEDISNIFDGILGGDFHEVNTAIEKLDLRDNLFEAFQNNSLCNLITRSHLVYLDLSYCGLEVIPDDVVLALASNKCLQVFRIAGNRLGDAGVFQLSKVFMSDTKTSVLNTFGLSCNRLSSDSLLYFANVLTTWPTKLREISICENPLVESTIVKDSLQKVFNVVIIEPSVDGAMAYADYLSEM